jgi:4-amino-4-deoxy-L-arabinose transferase-like glycosyltransferase
MTKERTLLLSLLAAAVLLRACYVLWFTDLAHANYWEYGRIAGNLQLGKGYSLYSFNGTRYTIHGTPESVTYPSAYMPPGYVLFLYPFYSLSEPATRSALVLLLQAILGSTAALAMYAFLSRHVSKRAAPIGAAIMAFFPEFVYATGSITPTIFFHLFFLLLLFVLYDLRQQRSRRAELLTALLTGILICFRSEFALFAGIILLIMAAEKRWKSSLRIALLVLALTAPWQIRNALVFGEWIPFTTSGGLNFFRGHNASALGTFSDEYILTGFQALPPGKDFEPALNRLYASRALECIKADPSFEIRNTAVKLFQFWFWDPSDPRSTHPLYVVPWLLLLGCATWGALRGSLWKSHRLLAIFLLYSTAVAVIFFVLPRYQTMMKVGLVPFAAIGVLHLWDRFAGSSRRGELPPPP